MRPVRMIGTAVLLLIFGVSVVGYAQKDRRGEKRDKSENDARPAQQKGRQQKKARSSQQRARQQQQDRGNQQHAQRQADRPVQKQRTRQQQVAQQNEQRNAWRQHRARSFNSEHRTWRQRGGYNGYRIPASYFRSNYGRNHSFRIYSLPFMMVGGYGRFQYGGYWFSPVDPYPEYWGNNWYQTDDVYVDYVDNGYYMYNRRYPGRPGIAISISF